MLPLVVVTLPIVVIISTSVISWSVDLCSLCHNAIIHCIHAVRKLLYLLLICRHSLIPPALMH
ncbi:hypothetical protein M1N78_00910 [Peptococcaceae bacterium]|nr:hypothetical protein [Peptococcaceae bacterium]